ncbi:hypothetical protein [Brevundimonas sp.]|uniref:hypothetical protein n=1 Tax=Brevundimonas sp. TaxID=1871086 RepID=UPI0035AF43B6
MKTALKIAACGLLLLGAAACGRMGALESPDGRETERAMRNAWDKPLADPAMANRPPSQNPIDGGPNDLIGGTAAGRDPY